MNNNPLSCICEAYDKIAAKRAAYLAGNPLMLGFNGNFTGSLYRKNTPDNKPVNDNKSFDFNIALPDFIALLLGLSAFCKLIRALWKCL